MVHPRNVGLDPLAFYFVGNQVRRNCFLRPELYQKSINDALKTTCVSQRRESLSIRTWASSIHCL